MGDLAEIKVFTLLELAVSKELSTGSSKAAFGFPTGGRSDISSGITRLRSHFVGKTCGNRNFEDNEERNKISPWSVIKV